MINDNTQQEHTNGQTEPTKPLTAKTGNGESSATRQLGDERSRGVFGQVRGRLQRVAATRLLPKRIDVTPVDASRRREELEIEPVNADDVLVDLARWIRRFVIPLSFLAWAGVAILILWGVSHITQALLLLVVASLLAYALAPLVTLFTRAMPRFLAIILVYLIVLGGVGALVYLVIRTAVEQITSLSSNLSFLLAPTSSGHPTAIEQTLSSFGITSSQIASIRTQVIAQLEGLAGNIVPLLTGVVNATLDILLVAVLSIYLLIDGSRVTQWLRQSMPRRQRGRVRFLLETLQRIVGGYIRGQILLCTIVGVLVGAGMQVLGVPYALLLGVLAFVFEFIPILGTLASGAICVLLALTKGGWLLAVIVLAYFIIVHVVEGDVVGPRIVGKAIGLHPVVAILALIIGGDLFGIWGALFASPIAGVLQAFIVALWSEWREMHPDDFQQAKDKLAGKIEEHVADKTLEPEPEAKLLLEGE